MSCTKFKKHVQITKFQAARAAARMMHRKKDLVEVCKAAWVAVPNVKILQAFGMRKDAAAEVLETDGWCNQRGGCAKRVHLDASYAQLRARLGIL
jgi:hypothetical protein